MMRVVGVVAVALALCGCAAQMEARYRAESEACQQIWPAIVGNFERRAVCFDAALATRFPNNPAVNLFMRGRLLIAKRTDRGEITPEEGRFQSEKLWFDLMNQQAQTQAAQETARALWLWR